MERVRDMGALGVQVARREAKARSVAGSAAQPGLPRRGRKADPDAARKVMHAAAVVFVEQGYAGTSIDDIAAVLDCTKGAVYHHYASKAELYFAVREYGLRCIDGLVRPVFESDASHAEKLQRMAVEHLLAIFTDFPMAKVGVHGLERGMKGIIKAASASERRELRRIVGLRDDYEDMFRSAIEAGIQAGVFTDGPVSVLTRAFLGSLNWTTVWFDPAKARSQRAMRELAETIAGFALRGLRR